MSRAERRLVWEAIALLGIARVVVLAVPFRLIAKWLSRGASAGRSGDEALLLRIRSAVTVASRNVPWNAVCLPQAIAAKAMLSRRGAPSAFHLGAGFDATGKLIAHAWLEANGRIVVGASGVPAVTPLVRIG